MGGRLFVGLFLSSPPTRGCSANTGLVDPHELVLPADAGVFRRRATTGPAPTSPPRRRGGVPYERNSPVSITRSSPPTRGCSATERPVGVESHVLPADAGVFRRPAPRAWTSTRPPRRRGGVPHLDAICPHNTKSSPPTRGCSVPQEPQEPAPDVLPADAGVFRHPRRPLLERQRPPRRRGGVPRTRPRPRTGRTSSPPTRGCSVAGRGSVAGPGVLPADAGVFRRAGRCSAGSSGPPRRRGGVPARFTGCHAPLLSSPPTRGCSDPAAFRYSNGSVLPADAGVFRPRGTHPPWSPGPPRRRGGVPPGPTDPRRPRESSPPTRGCSAWANRPKETA